MGACRHFHQLGRDAQALARLAQASLDQVLDAELAPDALHVDGLLAILERGVAGHDEKVAMARQLGDDVLGDAVAQILLLRVGVEVGEGQHGDRRPRCPLRLPRRILGRGAPSGRHAIDPDGLGDVLQVLLAEILELERELALHLALYAARDVDRAGLRHGLEPGRDIDAVAKEIAPFDHDVAEIDPDPEYDPLILRDIGIGGFHGALQLDSACDGIHRAAEFDQDAIAHQFDDAAVKLADHRLEDLGAAALERRERARLVALHETAISGHIGSQDGGETTLGALFGHSQQRQPVQWPKNSMPASPASLFGRASQVQPRARRSQPLVTLYASASWPLSLPSWPGEVALSAVMVGEGRPSTSLLPANTALATFR